MLTACVALFSGVYERDEAMYVSKDEHPYSLRQNLQATPLMRCVQEKQKEKRKKNTILRP